MEVNVTVYYLPSLTDFYTNIHKYVSNFCNTPVRLNSMAFKVSTEKMQCNEEYKLIQVHGSYQIITVSNIKNI